MSELLINRRNTIAFIEADPVLVTFVLRKKKTDGAGGFKWVDDTEASPRDPQVMRLIPQNDIMPVIQTVDGFQRQPSYVLLGRWDAVMNVWDYFTVNGQKFQIVSPIRPLHTDNAYERKGDVALV
jgi:hypothetical protein